MTDSDSDSDADEMVGTSFDVNKADRDAAKENTEHGEYSERLRERVREMAVGEPIAEAETKCNLNRDRWDESESEIKRATDELHSEHGDAVPFVAVEEMVETFCRERGDAIAADNAERLQQARSQVADRDADPNTVSVGADMSPVEAVEDLLAPPDDPRIDGSRGISPAYLQDPENPGVLNYAAKCDKNPKEFLVFLVEEYADEPVETGRKRPSKTIGEWMEEKAESATKHGYEFWYDGDEYGATGDGEADASNDDVSVATDGGDSS